MKKQKKHIPFPTLLIIQYAVFLALVLTLLSFCLTLSDLSLIIAVSITIFLIITDIVFIVLSLAIWWNVPFIIDSNGIIKKKQTLFWNEAVSVTIKNIVRTQYGYLLVLMKIVYSDSTSIQMELSPIITKEIMSICGDKHFLDMLKEVTQKL